MKIKSFSRSQITQEIARELIDYNPDTGVTIWRERDIKWFKNGKKTASHCQKVWNSKFAGKIAFSAKAKGYFVGDILGVRMFAHRIVWLWWYGEWPKFEIDHIDGNPSNNEIKNLRDVPHIINGRNTRMHKNNTSGANCIEVCKRTGKFIAVCNKGVPSVKITLGRFDTLEEAKIARKEYEIENEYHELHGDIK